MGGDSVGTSVNSSEGAESEGVVAVAALRLRLFFLRFDILLYNNLNLGA